jgi:hypothetical protein
MPLTEDQESLILEDFKRIFQELYGDAWMTKLTTNLRPSPIQQIATLRGVSVTDVKKVRAKLMKLGIFWQLYTQAAQAAEEELHNTENTFVSSQDLGS